MDVDELRRLRSERPLEALLAAVSILEVAKTGAAAATEAAQSVWQEHFVGQYADDNRDQNVAAMLLWDAARQAVDNCATNPALLEGYWRALDGAESVCAAYLPQFYARHYADHGMPAVQATRLMTAAFAIARFAPLLATRGVRPDSEFRQLDVALAGFSSFWAGDQVDLLVPNAGTLSLSLEDVDQQLAEYKVASEAHRQSLQVGRAMVRYGLRWLLNASVDQHRLWRTTILFALESGAEDSGTSAMLEIRRQPWSNPDGVFFVDPVSLGVMVLDDGWRSSFDRAYRVATTFLAQDQRHGIGDVVWRIAFRGQEWRRLGEIDLRQPLLVGASGSGAAVVSLVALGRDLPLHLRVAVTAEVDDDGRLNDVGGKFAKFGGDWAGARVGWLHAVLIGKQKSLSSGDLDLWRASAAKNNLELDVVGTVPDALDRMTTTKRAPLVSPFAPPGRLNELQVIARKRMRLDHYRRFAAQVCKYMVDLTRCAFQIWDADGVPITDRFKPHRICGWLLPSTRFGGLCQADDQRAINEVLTTCRPHRYKCWADFWCFMVPIELNSTAVGLISVGEFFITERRLSSEGQQACKDLGYGHSLPGEEGEVRKLTMEEVESLELTVQFLARIIADMLADRQYEQNCHEYIESLVQAAKTSLSSDENGIALAYGFILSVYGFFMSQVMSVSPLEQQLKLAHLVSPLLELQPLLSRIPDESARRRAQSLVEECATRVRTEVTDSRGQDAFWFGAPRKERVKLAECVDQVIDEFRAQIGPGEFISQIRARTTLIAIKSDLEQILRNLVHNAIKACETQVEICISVDDQEDALVLRVRDNGCGMSEPEWEHVFAQGIPGENFRRLGRAGEGRGLRNALELAERNWGDLVIEDSGKHGTTIKLTFSKLHTIGE